MKHALAFMVMTACAFQSEKSIEPAGKIESLPTTEDRALKFWLALSANMDGTVAPDSLV